MSNKTKLLTEEDVADRLGISVGTVQKYRYNGIENDDENLPYAKIGGNIRYREQDVEAFIDRHFENADTA